MPTEAKREIEFCCGSCGMWGNNPIEFSINIVHYSCDACQQKVVFQLEITCKGCGNVTRFGDD